MHIHCVNVNDAFKKLVRGFHEGYMDEYHLPLAKTPSTQGDCIYIQEPMLITYEEPLQRVLFNQARDANPFLTLYEALYMLTGRNDVAPLAYYAKQWNQYSDDGKTLNGSYGYRWRKALADNYSRLPGDEDSRADHRQEVDQINLIINHLKSSSTSRRAVLQMWNVEDDLLKTGGMVSATKGPKDSPTYLGFKEWDGGSKDVCCNLSVLFLIREVATKTEPTRVYKGGKEIGRGTDTTYKHYLDITVTNRSNDLIWGMLGTNYVTFSVLQEYMAAHIGVEVGKYYHFTNNCHVYTSRFKPQEWLDDATPTYYTKSKHPLLTPNGVRPFPLIKDPQIFDKEVIEFVEKHKNGDNGGKDWEEPFLQCVAEPMLNAFNAYKTKKEKWQYSIEEMSSCDWKVAATNWIQRRIDKQKIKDEMGE